MNRLLLWNNLRWYARLPVKWAVCTLAVFAVCFPYPGVLLRHLQHWRDPNALIEPDAPALAPLVEELRLRVDLEAPPKDVLRVVERFVYEKIKYAWDWDTWGMADYMPTVTEAVEKGREDCDGRAVVAASLLANLGFEAEIVTDFAHVWVKTDKGETMGPGKKKAIVAGDDGLRVQPGALAQLPRAIAYGIAPFPLARELIVIAVMWLALLRTRGGAWLAFITLLLLVDGLLLLRAGGLNYRQPTVWLQMWGGLHFVAAVWVQWVWAKRRADRLASSDGESNRSAGHVADDAAACA